MGAAIQTTLFDDGSEVRLGPLEQASRRVLGEGAWIDVLPGWLSGADDLFTRLIEGVPWESERRRMYERVVDVPRLVRFYGAEETLPDPVLTQARTALSAHYGAELGEPFATAGLCYYRDGRDSVAWHGDRIGRSRSEDTMVAVVSLGAPRPFLLRPRGGGTAQRLIVAHGDLVVMGGSCQRTWDHCVPKVSCGAMARISVQFRPRGVR